MKVRKVVSAFAIAGLIFCTLATPAECRRKYNEYQKALAELNTLNSIKAQDADADKLLEIAIILQKYSDRKTAWETFQKARAAQLEKKDYKKHLLSMTFKFAYALSLHPYEREVCFPNPNSAQAVLKRQDLEHARQLLTEAQSLLTSYPTNSEGRLNSYKHLAFLWEKQGEDTKANFYRIRYDTLALKLKRPSLSEKKGGFHIVQDQD